MTDRDRRPTPGLALGPYFPVATAIGTRVPRAPLWPGPGLPTGMRALRFDGQVVDRRVTPVAGFLVELWQADGAGRYRHPHAPAQADVPTGFSGYGRAVTDCEGRFAFCSLVPGPYVDDEVSRAPHLHIQITGALDRLVTQVFLPDNPLNRHDRLFQALRDPSPLIATKRYEDSALLWIEWTATVRRGAA